jgi:tRNA wybutosine-synthesizing protein 3
MPKDIFSKRKKDILLKKDKSSKGDWDKKIKDLCDKINRTENYYTTSSCSGRVILLFDREQKQPGVFLKVYHDLISLNNLKKDLDKISNNKEVIGFKQEPCGLHVACKDLKDAQFFLDKAKLSGWKKSGIISSNKRFVVECFSTEKLELPIIKNKKILVDNEFLKILVQKSNENLQKSWKKIEQLKKLI